MVKLGEGWSLDGGRVFHLCGPGLRGHLSRDQIACDCGVRVPRRVRLFRSWLSRDRRAGPVGDSGPDSGTPPADWT
jgi:hypothetical protein